MPRPVSGRMTMRTMKKGAGWRPSTLQKLRWKSTAVIHAECDRVRRVLVELDFFHLLPEVASDPVLGEHVAGETLRMAAWSPLQNSEMGAASGGLGGNRTYSITARRMISWLVLDNLKGLGLAMLRRQPRPIPRLKPDFSDKPRLTLHTSMAALFAEA